MIPLNLRTLYRSAAHPSVLVVAAVLAGCLVFPPSGINGWHTVAHYVALSFVLFVLVWLVVNRYVVITDRAQARVIRQLRAAALVKQVEADAAAMAAMPIMRCPEGCAGCADDQAEAQLLYDRFLLDTAVRHGHIPAERVA